MKPVQTIDCTGHIDFYGILWLPRHFVYTSVTEMHGIPGNDTTHYPKIWALHIFNLVFGWVWLHKEKKASTI